MKVEQISLSDAKAQYLESLGFIFASGQRSSVEAIQRLCDTLKNKGVTSNDPKFIGRINGKTTIFVYENDFNMPMFLHKAMIANQTKFFYVTSIRKFFMELEQEQKENNGED